MVSKPNLKCALFVFLCAVLTFAGCRRSRRGEQRMATREAWSAYVEGFLQAHFTAHPDQAVRAGRHEFDGQLPDWSAEGIAKEIKRLHQEKDRVSAFRDSELNEREHFERDYLASVMDADLFWLESVEWPF